MVKDYLDVSNMINISAAGYIPITVVEGTSLIALPDIVGYADRTIRWLEAYETQTQMVVVLSSMAYRVRESEDWVLIQAFLLSN